MFSFKSYKTFFVEMQLINSRGRNEKLCGTLETSRREYTGPVDFKFVSDDQVQKSGFLINYLTRPTGSSGLPTDDEYESSGLESP